MVTGPTVTAITDATEMIPRNHGRLLAGILVAGAATGALLLHLWSGNEPAIDPDVMLASDDTGTVALGRGVYAEHCASCHGDRLQGQPDWRSRLPDGRLPAPPHDADGHTWHHPDAALFALTKFGPARVIGHPTYVSDMPAYAEVLSDTEIVAVLSFIKSTWPPAIRDRHDRINDAARRR